MVCVSIELSMTLRRYHNAALVSIAARASRIADASFLFSKHSNADRLSCAILQHKDSRNHIALNGTFVWSESANPSTLFGRLASRVESASRTSANSLSMSSLRKSNVNLRALWRRACARPSLIWQVALPCYASAERGDDQVSVPLTHSEVIRVRDGLSLSPPDKEASTSSGVRRPANATTKHKPMR